MSNIFDDGFGLLMIALLAIVMAAAGYVCGAASIKSDCDKLNSFYIDDDVYICQRVK